MFRSLARLAIAFVLPVAAAAACWAPTQIVVRVDTDLPCETVAGSAVAISVAGSPAALADASPSAVTSDCSPSSDRSNVGSLVLVPSGDRSALVTIKVAIGVERPTEECLANEGQGCIVAVRRAAFIEHRTLNVPIRLERACLGVTCGPDTTCSRGACVTLDQCADDDTCAPPVTADGGNTPDAAPLACPPGHADCDGDPNNGCEADLESSARDCGTCGHDCGAAACKSGTCESFVFASGLDTPRGITVAGGHVYVGLDLVAPSGSVLRCPLGGCASPTLVSSGHSRPYTFATSGGSLYFGDEQKGVYRCALPNCDAPVNACAEGPQSLAVAGEAIIVASYANFYVGRCPENTAWPVYFALTPGEPLFVAQGGDAVFIGQGPTSGAQSGGIDRCLLPDGCGTTTTAWPPPILFETVANQFNQPTSLALDDAFVYWTESATGKVMRAARTLDQPPALIATGARTRSVVVDDTHVFWIDQGTSDSDGSIHRANKDGSAHVVLARQERAPAQLALGPASEPQKRIFWTTRVSPNGEIRYVARQRGASRQNAGGVSILARHVCRQKPATSFVVSARDIERTTAMSKARAKIYTHLWYAKEAEEAASFYASIFPDSRVDRVTPLLSESPSGPPGSVKVVDFTLLGQRFQAITAGPHHEFNDAISIVVECEDQAELDRYWNALLEGGGKPTACGWLIDRFGLRWQIVPAIMDEWMNDRDPTRSKRVTDAMMKMVKLDIAKLQAAYAG